MIVDEGLRVMHDIIGFYQQNWTWLLLVNAWQIVWKIPALWQSARAGHKIWFGVFMFVHLLAIPEIIYILFTNKTYRWK